MNHIITLADKARTNEIVDGLSKNIFLTDRKEFGKRSAIRMAEWKNNEFKKLLEERLEEVKAEQKARYEYIDKDMFIGRILELELLIERYSK